MAFYDPEDARQAAYKLAWKISLDSTCSVLHECIQKQYFEALLP